jgi:hypothetical protein
MIDLVVTISQDTVLGLAIMANHTNGEWLAATQFWGGGEVK